MSAKDTIIQGNANTGSSGRRLLRTVDFNGTLLFAGWISILQFFLGLLLMTLGKRLPIVGIWIVISAVGFAFALGAVKKNSGVIRLGWLGLLFLQAAIYIAFEWRYATLPNFGFLRMALLASYSALLLLSLLNLLHLAGPKRNLALCISITIGLIAADGAARLFAGSPHNRVQWEGGEKLHPVIGTYYPPYHQMKSTFADNPFGYFGADRTIWYRINSMGYRDKEYSIPKPANTFRVVCLGDSCTLGVGVRQEDTYAKQLEMILQDRRKPGGLDYEVINCGVSGYDTRQERLSYEVFASRYEPDLVLVTMITNDDRAWYEDVEKGYYHYPTAAERLSGLLYLISKIRFRRPPPDFSRCVSEIQKLAVSGREAGAPVVVFIFQTSTAKEWGALEGTMKKGLSDTDIPLANLGPALLSDYSPVDLQVSRYDRHPNHVAHRIAAEEIFSQLDSIGLLPRSVNPTR